MVRPEDALQSVRTAIMLGAVLPDMRVQAEALAADLADLLRIRKEIADEKDRLVRDVAALTEDRQRIGLLIQERQKKQTETEKALEAERQQVARAGPPGRQSQRFDRQGRAGPRQRQPRRAVGGTRRREPRTTESTWRRSTTPAGLRRRWPSPPPVADCRCRLTAPGSGNSAFPIGLGGTEKGISIATRPAAQVTAPCDGWVVYAGPFRNYGQVLILNAGGGYHVVLAGMDRISVNVGQFVLTGEPVAVMMVALRATVRKRRQPRLRQTSRRAPTNRCSTSSSARTVLQSIPARGGQQAKAKRFADDAQDISDSSRCGFGRGPDAAGDPAAAGARSASAPAPRPPPPTPTGSSTCSATCSSACAPTTSRSRTTPS